MVNSAKESVHSEVVAQVNAPYIFVFDHLCGGPAHQDFAVVKDIGAIDDLQCFLHVMVSDQHANPAVL